MHLTQGAIGNLINRYRAVLRKCRLLNTFGSLAVAGLLVLGPCSAAHAEQLVAPWTEKTITIGNGDTINADIQFDAFSENTKNNILTESLTLQEGGSLSIGTEISLIHRADAEQGYASLTVDMQGGTLTNDGFLQAESINISGGTITLTNTNATEEMGLRAESITISGGDFSLSEDASITAQSLLDISGGHFAASGMGHLRSLGITNISGDTRIDVSGSTTNVEGTITLGGNAQLIVAEKNSINQTQLDFPVHNTMEIKDNATISIGGLSGVDIRNGWVFPATVTQTGGSILVTDTTSYANGEYDGILSIRNVTYHLQGGSIHVGPLSIMNVEDDLIISGGSLKNEGQFAATRLDLSNAGNALSNTGFLSISSELLCSDAQLKDLVAASTASLLIEGTSSGQYSFADLGQSATLDAGMCSADVDARQKVVIGERGSLEAQTVTLNGDTFSINKDGRIKTNVLNLNNSGSNFTVTSGKLVLNGESGSRLSATGNGLQLNGGSAADTELVLGEFNSETGVPSSGGTLDAGITAANGTVSVVAGTWTLASGKTIDIGSGGVLNVGGVMDTGYSNTESLPAKLIVNGSLLSADAGNGTRGINILAGGTLEAGKNVLLSGTNRVNGLNVINTAANGTLRVTGLGTITKTDLAAIQGNLMTGAGLFDIADAIIDDAQVAPDGTIDYATLPPGA